MNLFKKLVLAGVFSAVLAIGVAGAGTASADDDHHHSHCWIEATNSIDPTCWNMVIWGGPSNGWIPRAPFLFGYQDYYLFNSFPYYLYFYNSHVLYPNYNYGYPLYNQGYLLYNQNNLNPYLGHPNYGDPKYGYWDNNVWRPYW